MKKLCYLLLISFLFLSCSAINSAIEDLKKKPEGKAEISSTVTYTYENVSYCDVFVAVTNTGNRPIYNATVSVKILSTKQNYCATSVYERVIPPGNTVYVPLNFMIVYKLDLEDEDRKPIENEFWKVNTAAITDAFYE